jgi:Periplasmic binding protein domain/Adenylate and Guanylate cyclase catalytic domain
MPVTAVAEAGGERRHVTVIFCDLVDSTGIAAKLDAEEWRDPVGAYVEAASSAITEMGGKVAKKLGDGLMALFGYPVAQENAQWIAETLKGKGNIVMIAGIAGASPAENRIKAAHEVFDTYPDIKILDLQYTDWSPAKGKTVMAALIQKYGKQIDAVWSDHGLEGSGAIEAFVDAGYKDGEIPPITCADLNGCLTLAVKHKVPLMNFDYPPKMGGVIPILNKADSLGIPKSPAT